MVYGNMPGSSNFNLQHGRKDTNNRVLRGDGAARGAYAGHDRASGEELACDGDPPSLAVGAARHEGKGHGAE